jgi:hypothetical protein
VKVVFGDSLDLGLALAALNNETVSKDEISKWATRVIADMEEPPEYIYTMLDLERYHGRGLRHDIELAPTTGFESEDEFQYLREVAVRRGFQERSFLGGKKLTDLRPDRKQLIDQLLYENFQFNVDDLPPL